MYSAEDVAAQLNVELGVLLTDYPDMFDSLVAEAEDLDTIVSVTATRGTRAFKGIMVPSVAVTLDLHVFCLHARKVFYNREVN